MHIVTVYYHDDKIFIYGFVQAFRTIIIKFHYFSLTIIVLLSLLILSIQI